MHVVAGRQAAYAWHKQDHLRVVRHAPPWEVEEEEGRHAWLEQGHCEWLGRSARAMSSRIVDSIA